MMSLLFTRLTYLVVLVFFFFFLPVELICHLLRRLVHFVLLLVSRRSWNISPSRQPGVILLLPLSVVRGSAVEPIVAGTCCRGSWALVTTGGMREMMVGGKCKLTGVEIARPFYGRCASYCRFRVSKRNEKRNL